MEKEFNFDQEVVTINIPEEDAVNKIISEQVSDQDYTVVDESEIDWSNL